jgi:hypothetical protein
MSRREAVTWAELLDIAHLTDPSLNDRLHQSCDFLKAIINHLLAAKAAMPGMDCAGRVMRIADGTSLSQPGSKGTDWRIHAVYDLDRGGFSHLEVTDKHGAEGLSRGAAVAGEIRIADRGFSQAKAIRHFIQSGGTEADTDVIVRLRWQSLRLQDANGQTLNMIDILQGLPEETRIADVPAWVNDGDGRPPFKIRLVILRKTQEATEATRADLRQRASRKQRKLDERSLIAAEYIVLATSLSKEIYSGEQILALYRLRWQIELAFKRLKSLLNIGNIPTKTKEGTQSWIYSHLILALLVDDLSQDFLEFSP